MIVTPIKDYADKAELFSELAYIDSLTYQRYGLSFSNQVWTEKEFELSLPEKFALSLVACEDRQILGYCIASCKGSYYYIHRFVARHDIKGAVGQLLLETFLKDKKGPVALMVNQINEAAIRFYERNGFHIVRSPEEIEKIVQKKDLHRIGDSIVFAEDYRCLLMVRS